MVHSKRISHTTNIKLEPYSVVSDTSTVPTDYASVASNESFCDTSYLLDGRPVFGPWPKPTLPVKSHSESNQIHKLAQPVKCAMKRSPSDTTMDVATHGGKQSKEATVSIPLADIVAAREKLSENNLHERTTTTISLEQTDCNAATSKSDDGFDGVKSVHSSIPMITSTSLSGGRKKLLFEQLQQRLTSLATPLVGEASATTGESSTDENFEINEIDSAKKPIEAVHSAPQSIKSKEIHDEIENDNELTTQSSLHHQQKHTKHLPLNASISTTASKRQKLMGSTHRTALTREHIRLLANSIGQQCNNNNNNNNSSNNANLMKNCASELIFGIGKILRKENGGIAALYKHTLEEPNSRFGKILFSMIT
ncbi:unnamed protein product [Litomosoides sigmodontis]|uniref:Uncharacterized protein n=1 Tax=Litomosoides sigmodontis TaxID=42156 RepID=A0A3P6TJ88_LITSI|nr:unnamed protein product [Litomosoides sigmodontis]